jgi:hypothetical protein
MQSAISIAKQRYRLIIALNRSILPITLTGTTVNRLLQVEQYSCTNVKQLNVIPAQVTAIDHHRRPNHLQSTTTR